MEQQPSRAKLFAALSQAQSEIKAIPKTGKNPHFKSNYAEIDVACNYVYPILAKHGLSIIQLGYLNGERHMLKTILGHASGESVESDWPVAPISMKPQEIGSATTYARRYSLMAITGLTAELEDDDGAAASKPAPPREIKNHAPQAPSTTAAEVFMPPSQSAAPAVGLSLKQVNRMYAIAKNNKWPVAYVQAYVTQTYKAPPEKLTRKAYEQACDFFANAEFSDALRSELKPNAPMQGSVLDAFDKAKKQGGYVDHTAGPDVPPPFNDDEVPF
jgi:hypothetical protein